jgi:hypothetical protein
MTQQSISPEAQIANLLNALRDTAESKPYNGQLQDIRKEIAYIQEQFAKLLESKLEPIPVKNDPFVE